ncbi:MAG: hypothetical protein K0R07_9 [Sedimentibacter sp.]|jgi:hypothetical protein|nr:hypothetical protein [Sedimentibacter sp.]
MGNLSNEEVARLAKPTLDKLVANEKRDRLSFLFNHQNSNWKITAELYGNDWEIVNVERRMDTN